VEADIEMKTRRYFKPAHRAAAFAGEQAGEHSAQHGAELQRLHQRTKVHKVGREKGYFFSVKDSGNVGHYTSLQLTPAGWPAISYYDWTNMTLKYTYKDAAGWHNQVVDGRPSEVGSYNSLQLTPTGWPAISYEDYTNYDL
jgi:hypothetical protein